MEKMKITIEGASIELTQEQIEKIEKAKKAREKDYTSFKKMLLSFGFYKLKGCDDAYGLDEPNCYAEILNHGRFHTLWMAGVGFKNSSSPPGGWSYSTPKEAAEEIMKHVKG